MADEEPFYAPFRKPPPPRVARPGELLWAIQRGAEHITAELRYHGEWGVEAQIIKDGILVIGHRRPTRALAVQWAEGERAAWIADGYEAGSVEREPGEEG